MVANKECVLGAASRHMAESLPALELHERLDSLWITYLRHLDEYAAAQKLMQKHLSAGFLSLARANFTARDGIRRFGKDFYHEKAVASRRVHLSSDRELDSLTVSVAKWTNSDFEDISSGSPDPEKAELAEAEPTQQPPRPSTPDAGLDDSYLDTSKEATANSPQSRFKDSGKNLGLPLDPIRWYGILIPLELRSAQSSFVSATEHPVAAAINAAQAMREVEVEIRRLRKQVKKAEKNSA